MARLVRRALVSKHAGYEFAAERWLIRLNSERRLAYTKISGIVLIDLDDLDRVAKQGRVEAS
jgi:hypothetical protein